MFKMTDFVIQTSVSIYQASTLFAKYKHTIN